MKPTLTEVQAHAKYVSYVVGFILSVITTLLAYILVVLEIFPKETLIYVVLGIAVVQLVVQLVFFLHLGHGGRWKIITFVSAMLIVLIVVIGSIWIMNNLDYHMMHMSPDEMNQYMVENEGI
ncbi:MAG: cytochrome o ubiquinol oxidase subunit IV [Patescibacteria group bacterium]